MKKNLLKQSVIAVLVGGAVSSYALAQEIDTTSTDSVNFNKGKLAAIVASIGGNTQILSGFKTGEQIYTVNAAGNLEKRAATDDDVNSDPLKGKGVVKSVLENQEAIKELNEDFDLAVNDLQQGIDANVDEIRDVERAVTKLGNQTNKVIKNLGDAVTELDSNLKDTQDAVGENNLRLDKAESDISDLRNLQGYIDLNTVRTLVNSKAEQADLDKALDKIEAIEDQNDEFLADITTLEERADENRKDINKNASRITETRNKQLLQDARLSNHSDRIGVNEAAIAANKTSITAHQTAIDANTANITAHTAAIATHTQRLDNLDNRVNNLNKDLKRGLAAQAALNGLFQPYNVGKLNLTAAVGGYKSQTAVAVGTGYRYNENIATKAGVAFTRGGGATYNVGVNFEW